MNPDLNQLEALLARVQRNKALPRHAKPAASVPAPAAVAAAALPTPVVAAPSAPVEPAYVPPPAAAPAPVPAFESVPPPPSPLDDSVDDLLADPFPASSAPPPPSPDPFPASSAPPPPPASLDPFPAHEAMPPVEVAASSIEPERTSGVMAVAEPLGDAPPEELLEDDIVEMPANEVTEDVVVTVQTSSLEAGDLDFDEEEQTTGHRDADEPPVSSSRTKVASTMDNAISHEEPREIQEGREVPLKTPPPESGPQAAVALPAGMQAPPAPDIDELLEADILPPPAAHVATPTTEQLGQTIDLEEGRGPDLELAPANPEPLQPPLPNEELEVTLPQREFGGGYDEALMPPPEAREDLEAHRHRLADEAIPPPPESLAQSPYGQSSQSGAYHSPIVTTESPSEAVSTVTVDAPHGAELISPELIARPDFNPVPVAKFVRADVPRPHTFLELLDASLTLGQG